MMARIIGFGGLMLVIAVVASGGGCASLQNPNSPTTQAWSQASDVTGAVAATVAAAEPTPWGQIIAGILGALSVIAGIVAHGAVSNNSAEQVVNAVTAGLQAASQNLAPGSSGSSPPAK
jgi:hypothetical protein